jgi:hypothetical protein
MLKDTKIRKQAERKKEKETNYDNKQSKKEKQLK